MKHNTHIYIAAKAIELIRQIVDNLLDEKGQYLKDVNKSKERKAATEFQRIFQYYQDLTGEATWAPDDILKDNDPFHIFKLFTDDEFPNHGLNDKPQYKYEGVTYYKFSGGLPFRIDHMSQEIINMQKLRAYNDQFSLKQIVYNFLLLSHYVSDAHVPMHCDLRDDPPGARSPQPSRRNAGDKPIGKYMKSSAHDEIEQLWDDAVTPVAISERVIPQTWLNENVERTDLSPSISFSFDNCKKGQAVKAYTIPAGKLMDFMINVCIVSKKRGQLLFPIDRPEQINKNLLPEITRNIFSDCIGNLISIWLYIWDNSAK